MTYKIVQRTADGETVLATGDEVLPLVDKAQELSNEDRVELEVVHEETEAVIVVTSFLEPGHFVPWTRVETPKFVAPHFANWRPAYTRKRVGAVVYRSLTSKSWMVLDTRTSGAIVVGTTVEAREITNKMRSEGYMIPAPDAAADVAATA
jgi:hypothetical protein